MSRLDELIQKLCPNGVEYRCLGNIGQVKMCKRILKSQTNITGGIPFYKIGTFGGNADSFITEELYEEYKEKYSYPKIGDILISASGTIGRTVVYNGEPAYYQDSNIVWLSHDESTVLNTFLRYCYELKPWNISSGGTIARLYNDNILKAKIPIPPLPIQREIVRILDSFTELTEELTEELTARKKQYEFYRDYLLKPKENIPMVSLGNLCKIFAGGDIPKNEFSNTKTDEYDVPIISNGVGENSLYGYTKKPKITEPAVTISSRGTIGYAEYRDYPYFPIVRLLSLIPNNKNELDTKYLYYSLQGKKYDVPITGIPQLTSPMIKKVKIPVPSLGAQRRLVHVLDNFDSICSDLKIGLPAEIEARQKQYEYYRDMLLTFAEKGEIITNKQTNKQTSNN